MDAIHADISAYSVTDKETKQEIKSIYEKFNVIVEPHGAVGLRAMKMHREETGDKNKVVCIETAAPAKFPEVIREVISVEPPMPETMKEAMSKEEIFEKMACNYEEFKKFLVEKF